MAIIPLPAGAEFDRIDWRPLEAVQVNRSQWNHRRRVLDLDNGYLAASVEIEVTTENEDRAWRAFHALLRGPANTFRLPATPCQQTVITGTAIQAAAAATAGATSLSTKNWANASVLLKAGQYVTVNDQLLLLTADVPASGTNRTITFEPPLRADVALDTTILTEHPTGLVALPPDAPPPRTVNGVMNWAFDVEEAF